MLAHDTYDIVDNDESTSLYLFTIPAFFDIVNQLLLPCELYIYYVLLELSFGHEDEYLQKYAEKENKIDSMLTRRAPSVLLGTNGEDEGGFSTVRQT